MDRGIEGLTAGRRDGGPAGGLPAGRSLPPLPRLLLLPAALLLSAPPPLWSQDAPTVLARAESVYASVTSLRAEFRQTIVNPMLGGPEEASGTLYLVKPASSPCGLPTRPATASWSMASGCGLTRQAQSRDR